MSTATAGHGQTLRWAAIAGAVLIGLVGLIHAYDAPDSFAEVFYKGALFAANGLAAAVAAFGILRGSRWGWHLGALVAAGSIVGYVISRTTGLPPLPPDEWLEPLGVASLVIEAAFLAVYVRAISGASAPKSRPGA